MEPNRLTPPDPVDLVPADSAQASIAETTREVAQLQREAELATLAADAAEARAAEAGVDGRAATWALVQMQRFLDGLRADVERDAQSIRDLAKERARIRLDQARTDAAQARGGSSAGGSSAPVVPAPVSVDRPLGVADPVPDVRGDAGNAQAAQVVHVGGFSESQVVPEMPEMPEPASSQPTEVEVVTARPVAVAAIVDPLDDASVPAPTGTFWTEPPPTTKPRNPLRRVPLSAVIEVLAVLAILVFVLLRLS